MPTTHESRIIAAPVREVWAAITDLETAHRWNQAWQRVEYLSSQREGVGTSFRAHTDDGQTFDFRVNEWAPMEFLAFEPIPEEPEEQHYLITLQSQAFLLEPAGDSHTRLKFIATASFRGLWEWVRFRFSPPGQQKNILSRILSPLNATVEWLVLRLFLWSGDQRRGLGRALDALQAVFEPQPDDEGPEEE